VEFRQCLGTQPWVPAQSKRGHHLLTASWIRWIVTQKHCCGVLADASPSMQLYKAGSLQGKGVNCIPLFSRPAYLDGTIPGDMVSCLLTLLHNLPPSSHAFCTTSSDSNGPIFSRTPPEFVWLGWARSGTAPELPRAIRSPLRNNRGEIGEGWLRSLLRNHPSPYFLLARRLPDGARQLRAPAPPRTPYVYKILIQTNAQWWSEKFFQVCVCCACV